MPNMLLGTLLMLLLAASLGEAVPPAYRSRVEEKANTPAASSAPPVYVSPAPGSYTIPIRKVGNALLVDVLLNDTLTVTMPIDTGASSTCIAPSVARRLHLNPQQADILPVQTANGIILVPTTEVSSVSVGGATVRGVEVIVQNTGGAGLLGMSFLEHFHVSIDVPSGHMVLTPLSTTSGDIQAPDHAEDWWRQRFRFYRQVLGNIDVFLREKTLPPTRRSQLERQRQVFQHKLEALDHKATLAAIPRQWRY